MQKLTDSDRLLKKCTRTVSQSVDMLPVLLSRIDREIAAQIIANLARSLISATSLKVTPIAADSEEPIDQIIRLIKDNVDLKDELDELRKEKSSQPPSTQTNDMEDYQDAFHVL